MSQENVENVEIVRSIFAAWERGDFSSAEWADPEIEFVIADAPAPGGWTGLAAMAEAWGEVLRGTDDVHAAAEQYRDLDNEHVLALTRYSGLGKTSQIRVGGPAAIPFRVRDGKVRRFVFYWDRERALADLGLEE